MAKVKPRVSKGTGGWEVALPAFGFCPQPHVESGFASREAAGRWLRGSSIGASDGTAIERDFVPARRHDESNWPMVVR